MAKIYFRIRENYNSEDCEYNKNSKSLVIAKTHFAFEETKNVTLKATDTTTARKHTTKAVLTKEATPTETTTAVSSNGATPVKTTTMPISSSSSIAELKTHEFSSPSTKIMEVTETPTAVSNSASITATKEKWSTTSASTMENISSTNTVSLTKNKVSTSTAEIVSSVVLTEKSTPIYDSTTHITSTESLVDISSSQISVVSTHSKDNPTTESLESSTNESSSTLPASTSVNANTSKTTIDNLESTARLTTGEQTSTATTSPVASTSAAVGTTTTTENLISTTDSLRQTSIPTTQFTTISKTHRTFTENTTADPTESNSNLKPTSYSFDTASFSSTSVTVTTPNNLTSDSTNNSTDFSTNLVDTTTTYAAPKNTSVATMQSTEYIASTNYVMSTQLSTTDSKNIFTNGQNFTTISPEGTTASTNSIKSISTKFILSGRFNTSKPLGDIWYEDLKPILESSLESSIQHVTVIMVRAYNNTFYCYFYFSFSKFREKKRKKIC